MRKPKTFFVVGTPAQAETADLVAREGEIDPILVSLEKVFAQTGTKEAVRRTGLPFVSLSPAKHLSSVAEAELSIFDRARLFLSLRIEVRKVLREKAPDVLVMGNDYTAAERIVIEEAGRVPRLLVQDGTLGPIPGEAYGAPPRNLKTLAQKGKKWIRRGFLSLTGILPSPVNYGCGGCDLIAAMGGYSREMLRIRGVPEDRIVLTGQPRLDTALRLAKTENRIHCERLFGRKAESAIVFAGWALSCLGLASPEYDVAVIRSIVDATRPISGTHLLVLRPHPQDPVEIYERALKETDCPHVVLDRKASVHDVLRACGLLICYNSTIGIEALIFGIPLVTLDSPAARFQNPYVTAGLALSAGTQNMADAVGKALSSTEEDSDRSRRSFLEHHLFSLDGQASRRVSGLIVSMAGTSPKGREPAH